ncbi:LamG-like jellyroll fold domain-containing protein [Leifsonia sp. LS-T14]|uniref:LamG-like jellyroll fold domain-containing protein n=1 Tax=unclassified Leifsonia TaxID=2663824 RepID=UPI0035A6F76D
MSLSWSRARARFAIVAAVGIVAAGAPAVVVPVSAEAVPARPRGETKPALVDDAAHAATEAEARLIARDHGHDVVVDDLSSPTLLVRARADGQMQAVSSQVPEQARVDGTWKPVESALVEHDRWWEPKVAAVPIRIGNGDSADIVSVRSESGDWITETWPYGDLPRPTVSKETAVFHDVLPGVDLRVKVTKAGMREVLVVKSAEAATDPRVADLRLGLRGATLSVKPETETLEAQPESGKPVVAATPLWWDSSEEHANADSPPGDEPQAVETTVAGGESVMDVAAIAAGDVTYPLFVDPDWSGYLQYDWYTDRAYPNQSYLNPPENSTGYGIQGGVGYLSRAFYRFDTAFLSGKAVSNARFNVVQNWSNSCAGTWTQLWQYGGSNVGFTWNSDPGQWVRPIDAQNYNTGGPCSPNPAWVGFSASSAAYDAALNGAPYLTLALRTDDESNSLSRKHFRWDAQLVVTYNSFPNIPTGASMISPSRGCSTDANNPAYVNGKQPITLQVAASDPDPGNVAADFYLTTVATGAEQHLTTTPLQAQGAALRHTISANTLADGKTYSWSSRASDYINGSPRTAPCYFVVDSTKPGLPTLAITSGAELVPGSTRTFRVPSAPGEPISVTITPPAGEAIAGYQVWWTSGDPTTPGPAAPVTDYTSALPPCDSIAGADARVVCAATSGVTSVTVAPPSSLGTLWVAAYDRAGNVSCGVESCDVASASSAAGIGIATSTDPDLSGGHRWFASSKGQTAIDDSVGSIPLKIGTVEGWDDDLWEDPPFITPTFVSLNRFVKPGVSHATESSASGTPPGHVLESTLGQLGAVATGTPAPPGSTVLFGCAYGLGNSLLTTIANCEGTGAASHVLGYIWTTAADVPKAFAARQIFRCRVGTDFFVSTLSNCEGQVNERSLGFVAVNVPSTTSAPVVDTRKTFTVVARVKPSTAQRIQTVVSTTGSPDSAFYLQAVNDSWRFCMRSQGPTKTTVCATAVWAKVDTTQFVTVIGHWDAINRRVGISLAVGNTLLSPQWVSYTPPADDSASTGILQVGSATSGGYPSDFFGGSIAGVAVYPSLLSETALRKPLPGPDQ